MRILESSEVTIYDPTDEVVFYCMEHFTVKNPEYARAAPDEQMAGRYAGISGSV